ncbi:MAG TPA: hypothetical protein VK171_13570 [Fimbriimonas sp.]|nr:hypothetical protein [Fimbriimonas sp.]
MSYLYLSLLCATTIAAGCSTPTTAAMSQGGAAVTNSQLSKLSDEFDNAASLSNWKRIEQTEGWGASQLESGEIKGGELVLMPFASSWYQDYRGVLLYKEVEGDFVVSTKVNSTSRDGRSAPRVSYSLGGIMVRTPRSDSANTWRPGQENYVFLSIGSADQPGNFQFEVKTTQQSVSTLEKTPAASGEAILQFIRSGSNIALLKKQNGQWSVHKRYTRSDMPSTLQVGFTVYTDWDSVSKLQPPQHNRTVIRNGNPDLLAKFDYMRFHAPKLGRLDQMSDSQLIQTYGDSVL